MKAPLDSQPVQLSRRQRTGKSQSEAQRLLNQAMIARIPPLESADDRALISEKYGVKVQDFGDFQIVEDGESQVAVEPESNLMIRIAGTLPEPGEEGSFRRNSVFEFGVQDLPTIAKSAAAMTMDDSVLLPARHTAQALCHVLHQLVRTVGWVQVSDPLFLLVVVGMLAERVRREADQEHALMEKRRRKGSEKGRHIQKAKHDALRAQRVARIEALHAAEPTLRLYSLCLTLAREELSRANPSVDGKSLQSLRKTLYDELKPHFPALIRRRKK